MLPEWLWQNNLCLINHWILFSILQVNIYLTLLSTCSFSDIVHFLSLILTPTSPNLKRGHLSLSCLCVSLDFNLKKLQRKSNSAVQFVLNIHQYVLHIYEDDNLLHEGSKYWGMNSINNRWQIPDYIHLRDSSSNLDSKGQRGKCFARKNWKSHG